jgi:hypothetical protein
MKRLMVALLLCAAPVLAAQAGNWDLVRNTKRLEALVPDYADNKDVDRKFLEILDLTEKTKTDAEIYPETKRIATNAMLTQSRYMDSFMYYMLARAQENEKTAVAETEFWLGQLKNHERSPHLLPAYLVRLRQLPKGSPEAEATAEALASWVRARAPESVVRVPEYTGNILLGYKVRMDFAGGDVPKLYKARYYRSSTKALDGFQDDETYVAVLGIARSGREDVLNEMIGIYKNAGKRKEAGDLYYELGMMKANAKDLKAAADLLENAVKFNPEHTQAGKERARIKLELTYQSLSAPAEAPKPADAPKSAEPAKQ